MHLLPDHCGSYDYISGKNSYNLEKLNENIDIQSIILIGMLLFNLVFSLLSMLGVLALTPLFVLLMDYCDERQGFIDLNDMKNNIWTI